MGPPDLPDPPTDVPVRVVLDTDAFNEVDDQFALAYLLRRPGRVRLEAVHAAPFHNSRSDGPADGMLKSAAEARKIVAMLAGATPVVEGSRRYMRDPGDAVDSPAVDALIEAAKGDGPLYVVAIGAATNVASALVREPALRERIVVCWLGGHGVMPGVTADRLKPAAEFNFQQDPAAASVLFDGGVPLAWFPCWPAAGMLATSAAELERDLAGRSAIGDYLTQIVAAHPAEHGYSPFAHAKQIWDLAPCAWLCVPGAVVTRAVPSPTVGRDGHWAAADPARHRVREAVVIDRDAVFRDVFAALAT